MTGIGIYITVTITLLGVAYPILLQVIARLDEKYSSDHILSLFEKEPVGKIFKLTLITSLVLIVVWTLKLPPLFQVKGLNFLINNSASISLAISSIALVVAFFFFVDKILIYYTPNKFIVYLIAKHNKAENDFRFFEALADILLLSIKQQQRNIALTLSDFFYTAFRIERDKYNNEPVIYPDLYYEIVYKTIEELAILKEKRNYHLEYRTAGGIWLLGELQGKEISEKTYSWIWSNLRLALQYEQDDMIVYHWEVAHQFYTYSLPFVYEEFDNSAQTLQVSNIDAVTKRNSEREKFIEFHYALGGLLVYQKKYDSIKRIFNHTNSQPPTYELLPESMNEIFNFYFQIQDPYEIRYPWISTLYPFPNQSGLNSDSVIKKWISSYMAILFLRQYTLYPYLITMRPLDFPTFPQTQGEIKQWIDGLDFFKILVAGHLENRDLLEKINFDIITIDWCQANEKPYPLDFIDTLKSNLQKVYQNNALTLPISPEKVTQFENKTREIIESTLSNCQVISNNESIDGDLDKWYINGQRMLQSKDAFSENPEVHHTDFDSFLASLTSREIRKGVSSTFLLKKTKTYLLRPEDIFNGIDILSLNQQYIIVGFGFNIDYFINHLKITGLTSNKYKGIDLQLFNGSRLVDNSLFILKKTDLPKIATKLISEDMIAKYSLNKISEILNLYCSVIDLNNTTEEIFIENKHDKEEAEIRESVLLSIIISTEILWKKNIEVIHIIQHSEYRQMGLPNSPNDIIPLEK